MPASFVADRSSLVNLVSRQLVQRTNHVRVIETVAIMCLTAMPRTMNRSAMIHIDSSAETFTLHEIGLVSSPTGKTIVAADMIR